MDYSAEEILIKLNLSQLKNLIALYGLEKPHSKSSKSDHIEYIKKSNIALDPRMLVNYFGIDIKPKKIIKQKNENVSVITDMKNVVADNLTESQKKIKTPEKRRSKK